jgi:hypothetical protein
MLVWRDRRLTYGEVDRRIDALRTARQPHHRCGAAAARWHQLIHRRGIRLSRPGHAVPRCPDHLQEQTRSKTSSASALPLPPRRPCTTTRTNSHQYLPLRCESAHPATPSWASPTPEDWSDRCARLRRLGQRTQRSQRALQLFPADERCASPATRSQTFTKRSGHGLMPTAVWPGQGHLL